MTALFGVLLVASMSSAVTPVTAGADPAQAPDAPAEPVATWSNLGWSADPESAGALSGGADAWGTVEVDWQASADAVTGESFTLGLPSRIRGDDRDPLEVQLATDDGYLGATGTWSSERDELTVELEQDGLPDGEDSTELLGGTLSFDVVWSDKARESTSSGARELRFTGPGLDGADNKKAATLQAQYEAPVAPLPSASPSRDVDEPEAVSSSSAASATATAKPAAEKGQASSTPAPTADRGESESESVDADSDFETTAPVGLVPTKEKEAKAPKTDQSDTSDDEGVGVAAGSGLPAELPDRDRPAVEVGPDAPEATKLSSVLGLFSGLVEGQVATNVNPDIEVDIADGEVGFVAVDPAQTPQLKVGSEVDVRGTWDATSAQVKPGEQFTVRLPEQMQAATTGTVDLVGTAASTGAPAPVWGECAIGVTGMVCTLGDSVDDAAASDDAVTSSAEPTALPESAVTADPATEADLSGEFVIRARATSWVAPKAGVDVGLNGEMVHRELPGDGGIADDFVQPELSVEAVSADEVTAEAQSQTSSWSVTIPGQTLISAQKAGAGEVVVQGSLDTDGLSQGTELSGERLRLASGRATMTALTGATAELAPVADSELGEYEVTIDLAEVDADLVSPDLRYRLDYALEVGELVDEREGGSWVLDNTVTVAGESASATAAVAGPAASEGQMRARMAAFADTDICEDPTMWASDSTSIREYTAAGVPTGQEFDMLGTTSSEGFDIAMDSAGEIMWAISGGGKLDAYLIATGEHLQRFTLDSSLLGVANSLSFTGDTLIYGVSYSSKIMAVDNLPVPVAGGPDELLSVSEYLNAGNAASLGYAGDFVTLADGSIFALATQNGILGIPTGGTRMLMFDKLPGGGFAPVRRVGEAVLPGGGTLSTYGGTFVDGSLYFAGSAGAWYRMDSIPQATTTAKIRTIEVATGFPGFLGATSIQESNAICSSPNIEVSKTAGAVSGPDAQNHFTASYSVTVTNSGFAAGTYAALTDTPAFDTGLEVHGASWTGATAGSAQGAGPFPIDTRNVNLAAGASNTYQVVVEFSYPETATAVASPCTPATPGTGLTNIAAVSGSSAINDEGSNVACLPPPPVPPGLGGSLTWNKIAAGTTEMLAGSEWELTPVDAGGQPTGPAAQVQDCIEAAAAQCTGPDTDASAGGFLVAGLTNGQYMLVETKAPAGYVLDDTERTVTIASDVALLGSIENTQQQGLVIPLTGGMGADKFLWGGAALAALVALMLALRHRQQAAAVRLAGAEGADSGDQA